MEIAGLKSITLYENVGISYIYYTEKINNISSISNNGTIDIFTYCEDAKFKREIKLGNNYEQLFDDTLEFYVQDFSKENRALIERFQNSICGYIAKLEFLSGKVRVLQNAFFCEKSEMENNKNSFLLNFSYKKQSNLNDLFLV